MTSRLGIGLAVLAMAAGVHILVLPPSGSPLVGPALAWQIRSALLYVCAGVVAWFRRPATTVGPLMGGVGVAVLLSFELLRLGGAVGFTLALLAGAVPTALLAHLAVALPSGRLYGSFDRMVVAIAYIVILGEIAFVESRDVCVACPRNLLLLPGRPGVVLGGVWPVVTLVGIGAFAIVLVQHWRTATAAVRRTLAPVLVTALVLGGAHAGWIAEGLGFPFGFGPHWREVVFVLTTAVPWSTSPRLRSAGYRGCGWVGLWSSSVKAIPAPR